MPSNRLIKRTALSTKYNFDIWGFTHGDVKFSGLMNRLYLSPRFMLEVKNALIRHKYEQKILNTAFKYRLTQWYWRAWKSATAKILAFRDPFPAYDRPKNMTQVLKKRSMHNLLILKNLRLRLYFGYKKEYQYREYLSWARRTVGKTHTELITQLLESRLVHLILRAGFAKNAEIARYLIINGYIRVNNQICTNPDYIVAVTAVVRMILPDYLEYSDLVNPLIYTYQRISIPKYFIINWKLMSIRFVENPTTRHFSHPHFNLRSTDVSFFYGAI